MSEETETQPESKQIDREGTFKVKVTSWALIPPKDDAKTMFIAVDGEVVEMFDDGAWTDWRQFQVHTVGGRVCVVKRDGAVNQMGVDQLVRSLGWNGDLRVFSDPPPAVVVQMTVKLNQKYGYRMDWMNPENHVPQAKTASPDEVRTLQNTFGSLLRAAASATPGAKKPAPKSPVPAKKAPPAKAPAPPVDAPPQESDPDVPF